MLAGYCLKKDLRETLYVIIEIRSRVNTILSNFTGFCSILVGYCWHCWLLISFRVYCYLQDENLVKNMPKIQILSLLNPKYPIWRLNSKSRHLQWLSIVIMIENDIPECVLTCFSVNGYLQDENLVKNMPNIQTNFSSWRYSVKVIKEGVS